MALTAKEFVETGISRPGRPFSPRSQEAYLNHISQFEIFLHSRQKTVNEAETDDILVYIDWLKQRYSQNSVATKVPAIKSYFKWLKQKGAITHCPRIPSQRHMKPVHEVISADVIEKLLNQTSDNLSQLRDRAFFSLIVFCGFKTQEAIAINKEDVDLAARTVICKNKIRSIENAFDIVKRYVEAKAKSELTWTPTSDSSKEPFFLNKNNTRISGRSVRRRLHDYLEKMGVPDFTTLDLQYTCSQNRGAT